MTEGWKVSPTYEIQIKQRGGKWVPWCECKDYLDSQRKWATIRTLRRTARLLEGKKIIAKYDPPKLTAPRRIT